MKDQQKRCNAISKRTGRQCKRPAVPGYEICYCHGANHQSHGGHPKRHKNVLKHWDYMNKLLDDQEKILFEEYFQKLKNEFVLNSSSDQMSAELASIYFVKLTAAIESGNPEAIYKMDLLVRNRLKDLKATKDKQR